MRAIQLYTQISALPGELQKKVADYIDYLKYQAQKSNKKAVRVVGLAKGMITMKDNFDDPIEDFNEYM
ncbi:MAG: DUF2281 domain-containing protein [Bacteroidia bacterium]|nr:DUF2281 domain-containing protein [Bacteroidia bacterium]